MMKLSESFRGPFHKDSRGDLTPWLNTLLAAAILVVLALAGNAVRLAIWPTQ